MFPFGTKCCNDKKQMVPYLTSSSGLVGSIDVLTTTLSHWIYNTLPLTSCLIPELAHLIVNTISFNGYEGNINPYFLRNMNVNFPSS